MVKVGLEVRYVCRDERASSRVGRSVREGVLARVFFHQLCKCIEVREIHR